MFAKWGTHATVFVWIGPSSRPSEPGKNSGLNHLSSWQTFLADAGEDGIDAVAVSALRKLSTPTLKRPLLRVEHKTGAVRF